MGNLIRLPAGCENGLPLHCPPCDCTVCPGGTAIVTLSNARWDGYEDLEHDICAQEPDGSCEGTNQSGHRYYYAFGYIANLVVEVPMCRVDNGTFWGCRGSVIVPHVNFWRFYCRPFPGANGCNDSEIETQCDSTHLSLVVAAGEGPSENQFMVGVSMESAGEGYGYCLSPAPAHIAFRSRILSGGGPPCGLAIPVEEDAALYGLVFRGSATVEFT